MVEDENVFFELRPTSFLREGPIFALEFDKYSAGRISDVEQDGFSKLSNSKTKKFKVQYRQRDFGLSYVIRDCKVRMGKFGTRWICDLSA